MSSFVILYTIQDNAQKTESAIVPLVPKKRLNCAFRTLQSFNFPNLHSENNLLCDLNSEQKFLYLAEFEDIFLSVYNFEGSVLK